MFGITISKYGEYKLNVTYMTKQDDLAQLPLSVFIGNRLRRTATLQGTSGEWQQAEIPLGMVFGPNHFVKLYFGQTGLILRSVELCLDKETEKF